MSSKLITLGERRIREYIDENERVEIRVFRRLKGILKNTSSVLYFKPKIFYYEYEVNPDILWIKSIPFNFVPTSNINILIKVCVYRARWSLYQRKRP